MDRTAGNPNWIVVKPYPTQARTDRQPYVVSALLQEYNPGPNPGQAGVFLAEACGTAYNDHFDPLTDLPYVPNPTTSCTNCAINGQQNQNPPPGYIGFNRTVPDDGEPAKFKARGRTQPLFTACRSIATVPVLQDWAAKARRFLLAVVIPAQYLQRQSVRRLRGYTNLNLALILASDDGCR